MSTVTQSDTDTRLLQAKVTDDAFRRIKAEAGRRLCKIGDVVSDLATQHLTDAQSDDKRTHASDSE
jgi:hypothetical protein